jgi:hypothetical protein
MADWRNVLTPKHLTIGGDDAPAAVATTKPIMAVCIRGQLHRVEVEPGPDGLASFKRQVAALLGYDEPDAVSFNVVFECKSPNSDEKVHLQGFEAFEAATHCATVSAARRLINKNKRSCADDAAAANAAAANNESLSTASSSLTMASSSSSSSSSSFTQDGLCPCPECSRAQPTTLLRWISSCVGRRL